MAGAATSVLVGTGLALIGAMAIPENIGLLGPILVLLVTAVALTRESGLVVFPLPQIPRQTSGAWAKRRRSGKVAATLWGLDLGLTFTTWLTFSGAWVLAAMAFLGGDVGFGAALFAAYWFGRVLPVWLAPLLMERATDTPQLLTALVSERALFRSIHVAGLISAVLVVGSWIATGATT